MRDAISPTTVPQNAKSRTRPTSRPRRRASRSAQGDPDGQAGGDEEAVAAQPDLACDPSAA